MWWNIPNTQCRDMKGFPSFVEIISSPTRAYKYRAWFVCICRLRSRYKVYVDMFRRNRISQEHRQRIVQAFENEDEDYLLVADTLGVNRSTARGIVARFIREGRIHELPRGGRNNIRVDEEMRDCIEKIINDNCVLTLVQINRELRRRLPQKPEIHESTVARTLNGMLFTLKLVRVVPNERNRPM